jgi:exosortase
LGNDTHHLAQSATQGYRWGVLQGWERSRSGLGNFLDSGLGHAVNQANRASDAVRTREGWVTSGPFLAIAQRPPFAYSRGHPLGRSGILGHSANLEALAGRWPAHTSRHEAWWQAAGLLLLVGWLYFTIVSRLVGQWWHDPNFSHGFFVPAFALFVVWQERERLLKLPAEPSWWGMAILVAGLLLLVVGALGAELFLSRFSLLMVLAGLIVLFLGWQHFRLLFFPWAFLILMIPIPALLFNQITFPLQLLASKVAAGTLPLFGVPVLREGNVINLPAMPLEVAEACSGIRSLLSLATLGIIYGYVLETRIWIRVGLALAALPIAVVANSLRIVGTGLLVQYWDPDKAEGFFHVFSGWLVFVVSLLMLFLLHQLLRLALRRSREPS